MSLRIEPTNQRRDIPRAPLLISPARTGMEQDIRFGARAPSHALDVRFGDYGRACPFPDMEDVFLPPRNSGGPNVRLDARQNRERSLQIDDVASAERAEEELLADVATEQENVIGAEGSDAPGRAVQLRVVDRPRKVFVARKLSPCPEGVEPKMRVRIGGSEERITVLRMSQDRDFRGRPRETKRAQSRGRGNGVTQSPELDEQNALAPRRHVSTAQRLTPNLWRRPSTCRRRRSCSSI